MRYILSTYVLLGNIFCSWGFIIIGFYLNWAHINALELGPEGWPCVLRRLPVVWMVGVRFPVPEHHHFIRSAKNLYTTVRPFISIWGACDDMMMFSIICISEIAWQFLIFNDGCVELSWKWGVPKQYLKWEVVPDSLSRLKTQINYFFFFNLSGSQ